jgi:glycosyltransferase involved in cell wall biosynthesis
VNHDNRVLFLGHDASRSGAPLLLLELIKWLKVHSSIRPSVLLKRGGELEPEYIAAAPTRNLNKEFEIKNLTFPRRVLRKLRRTMVQQKDLSRLYPPNDYPVIYANTIATCDLAQQLTGQGRRLIHHIHELSYATGRFGATESLKKAVSKTSAYIAASHAVQEYLEASIGVPAAKIHLIHEFPIASCMDDADHAQRKAIRTQLGIAGDAFIIGMCGTAEWRKGTDLFVQLAMHMKGRFGSAQCHFVWLGGSINNDREALYDVAKLGLGDICHFIPAVPNPEIYFSTFDLFALTSREDPFSVAMLEAAVSRLPIVCFAGAGGGPELVENDAGIIVPYLDVPAMAKACFELLLDDNRRRQLGENARAKVQARYTLDQQGPKLFSVIESAMSKR